MIVGIVWIVFRMGVLMFLREKVLADIRESVWRRVEGEVGCEGLLEEFIASLELLVPRFTYQFPSGRVAKPGLLTATVLQARDAKRRWNVMHGRDVEEDVGLFTDDERICMRRVG